MIVVCLSSFREVNDSESPVGAALAGESDDGAEAIVVGLNVGRLQNGIAECEDEIPLYRGVLPWYLIVVNMNVREAGFISRRAFASG